MVDWAGAAVKKPINEKKEKLVIWANASGDNRKQILNERRYEKGGDCNYLNRQLLDKDFI